ncbi:Magnesium-transporting ATPase, P-type [Thalictrum thalictroides]|uniref:Magnesium-transporting ATPase, P-type 1 n=1 Tax=Thalictrum thalictroides TaxID=46969 RepID=A0A7J6WYL4_THATH|nr:Magnesium-transporting ATPase, P-type [Thalictrum thalictroides]
MGINNIVGFFTKNNHYHNPAFGENLVTKHEHSNTDQHTSFTTTFFRRCARFFLGSTEKNKSGVRSKEEEKVHTWLYALAQSDKDLVFEYVKSTERGLSFKEAERRLKECGPNVPISYHFPCWWQLLWNASFHPFNIILVVLAMLSLITSDYPNGCIMLTWVFISVTLRFIQENSSTKASMRVLELLKCPVKVQRCAGRVVQTELIVKIDHKDIVAGDIVIFGPGDLFPGDVRLLTSKDLIVSQSSLTGEAGTTKKIAYIQEDQTTPLLELQNICFMGTSVVSGSGTALVVSTGPKTYMSTIFSITGKQKPPDDFHKCVRHLSYGLICVMVVVVPTIFLANYYTSGDLSESILFAISVAVALTPQALPLIVNMSLAIGALAMAKDKCIVKSLDAIQKMGSMDILCIDKTGTLTTDQVVMFHHLDSWGLPKERVLQFGFLNSYFKSELKNPVDDAIMAYVYTNGYRFEQSQWRKINEIPFDFTRKRVSVIIERNMNTQDKNNYCYKAYKFMVTKGALEEVVKICSFVEQVDKGVILPLSQEETQRILQMGEALNNDGLMVIGVAIIEIELESHVGATGKYEWNESNMVFLGMLTFFDPPKDSAKQAFSKMGEKGVEAKVLTGDSLSLAIRICQEVGIRTTHTITGPDLQFLDHDTFHETVESATVLARLTPTQKLRVVQSLQTMGNHVVGYLGDGINDSLVLEAADVGISVDSGASVAKDLADIILLEKDLNVLVSGVEQGRIIYGNTMKYIKVAVITNVGSIVSLLIATIILPFEPLTPRQLLTQNFLYNVGHIMIPWDKMEEGYAKKTRPWSSKDLLFFMMWNGPVCLICDIGALSFIWFYYKAYSYSHEEFFRAAWFIDGLLMQTFSIYTIRTAKIPFVQEIASWPVIISTVIISSIGIAFLFTPIGRVMGMKDLPLSYFGFLIVLFLGYFTLCQLVKRIYILSYNRWL